jgi:hypothetical protein
LVKIGFLKKVFTLGLKINNLDYAIEERIFQEGRE